MTSLYGKCSAIEHHFFRMVQYARKYRYERVCDDRFFNSNALNRFRTQTFSYCINKIKVVTFVRVTKY